MIAWSAKIITLTALASIWELSRCSAVKLPTFPSTANVTAVGAGAFPVTGSTAPLWISR